MYKIMNKCTACVPKKYKNLFKEDYLFGEGICTQCTQEVLITHNQLILRKNFPEIAIWCLECINKFEGNSEVISCSDKDGNYAIDERKLRRN